MAQRPQQTAPFNVMSQTDRMRVAAEAEPDAVVRPGNGGGGRRDRNRDRRKGDRRPPEVDEFATTDDDTPPVIPAHVEPEAVAEVEPVVPVVEDPVDQPVDPASRYLPVQGESVAPTPIRVEPRRPEPVRKPVEARQPSPRREERPEARPEPRRQPERRQAPQEPVAAPVPLVAQVAQVAAPIAEPSEPPVTPLSIRTYRYVRDRLKQVRVTKTTVGITLGLAFAVGCYFFGFLLGAVEAVDVLASCAMGAVWVGAAWVVYRRFERLVTVRDATLFGLALGIGVLLAVTFFFAKPLPREEVLSAVVILMAVDRLLNRK